MLKATVLRLSQGLAGVRGGREVRQNELVGELTLYLA